MNGVMLRAQARVQPARSVPRTAAMPRKTANHERVAANCACGGGCPDCQSKLPIQTKLSISEPGDIYEQEADRVAEQVMRMPAPTLQRNCAASAPDGSTFSKYEEEGSGLAQRRVESGNQSVPDNFHQDLGSGQPLDADTRAFMEPCFGADLSSVPVHTDIHATQSAREVNALAFTVGRNVVFGAGQYAPGTMEGRKLLAHELTHVVQQTRSGRAAVERGEATSPFATAGHVEAPSGGLAKLHPVSPRVQRQHTEPRPGLRAGTAEHGRCVLRAGVFLWVIIPGTGPSGGCFNVQIAFLPGRVERLAVGARWVPDVRPIALVQTRASIDVQGFAEQGFAERPEVDMLRDETDPFYGAEWNRLSGAWGDEPGATQRGCRSLPRADTGSDHGPGSRFSRPGALGAVINDSPMVNPRRQKDFQTTAVVMATGVPLASLTWTVKHDGTEAVVGSVACHERPVPNVQFGTPGYSEVLPGFFSSGDRSVIDGFARDSSTLPARASAVLDQAAQRLQRGPVRRQVVLSGATTPDETDPDALSRARAESAEAYLTSHGVDRSAIIIEAFGASFARQSPGTSGAASANRRVQLTLIR